MKRIQYRSSSFVTIIALSCLLAFGVVGCGGPVRVVDIDSKPTEATIFVDGVEKGSTRATVQIQFSGDPTQRVAIQIIKPRYKPVLQYWSFLEVPEKGRVFVLTPDT